VALTLLLFGDTDSQAALFAGVVEKLNVIGVVLDVVRLTVVETAWPVTVFNVTEAGLARMAPTVPPPPPLPTAAKVTEIATGVPPPEAEVGVSVIEPLQELLLRQAVLVSETVKLAGAVSPASLTEKKLPT